MKKMLMQLAVAAVLLGVALWTMQAGDAPPTKPKPYPLKTCVVSGEKLGGMGEVYTFVHEGQEIKLCCEGCLKDFKKDPAKYMKKIAEAQKKK